LYLIKSGSTALEHTTFSGETYFVGLLNKFTFPLGTSPVITGQNFRKINLCISTELEIIEVPAEYYDRLLDDTLFFKKITRLFFNQYREIVKTFALRMHKPLYCSVAFIFFKLDQLNELNSYNIIELAKICYCSRVNFYRSIETLKEMGIIDYKNKEIRIVDYDKLEELLRLAIE
jgi:hypothetical protein